MSEGNTSPRETIHDALQSTSQNEDGGLPDGAMLMGWITVCEWMDGKGQRWLSRVGGNSNGDSPPEWQVQGYLHNALFCAEDFGDEDYDEDEPEAGE